jgi:hypothetical protein
MKRPAYAVSPILKNFKEFAQRSVVNIAFVPPSMGKTTACFAIMKKYVKEGTNRGLCFSPYDTSGSYYLEHMVTLLGFMDTKNPPVGLVAGLVHELDVPFDGRPPSYLVLDDFMPDGPNITDVDLISAIKTTIRSRNIIAVVLTSNKQSADYMLTMNGLATIIPLVGTAAMKNIRAEWHQGEYQRRDKSFNLDWEANLSMEWDAEELKKAILVDPCYEKKSGQEKRDLKSKIDTLLQNYTDEERKTVSPADVLQQLQSSSGLIEPIQTMTSGTSPRNATTHQETGAFCSGCLVM